MLRPNNMAPWDMNETSMSEPDQGHQDNGWREVNGVPEKPSYQIFNYYMNSIYKWVDYLFQTSVFSGNLENDIQAIGGSPATIIINHIPEPLTSDLQVPSNIKLIWHNNCVLDCGGFSLIVRSKITAGGKIFENFSSIDSNIIDVSWFGVSSTNSAAINTTALELIFSSVSFRKLLLNEDIELNPIVVNKSNFSMIGDNVEIIINTPQTAGRHGFDCSGANFNIKNIKFLTKQDGANDLASIYNIRISKNVFFENVDFFANNLDQNSTIFGIVIDSNCSKIEFKNCHLIGKDKTDNQTAGILSSGSLISFKNCYIENSYNAVKNNNPYGIEFKNCLFENCGPIYVVGNSDNMTFQNCRAVGDGTNNFVNFNENNDSNINTKIKNNIIDGFHISIYLNPNTSDIQILGNSFINSTGWSVEQNGAYQITSDFLGENRNSRNVKYSLINSAMKEYILWPGSISGDTQIDTISNITDDYCASITITGIGYEANNQTRSFQYMAVINDDGTVENRMLLYEINNPFDGGEDLKSENGHIVINNLRLSNWKFYVESKLFKN